MQRNTKKTFIAYDCVHNPRDLNVHTSISVRWRHARTAPLRAEDLSILETPCTPQYMGDSARGNNTEPEARWKQMRIRVQGEGSRFCMNRGEHHKNNSIYFEMERDVCHQRCFCEDDVVGATGMTCKDYTTRDRGGRGLWRVLFELFTPDPGAWLSRHTAAMPVIQLEKRTKTTVVPQISKNTQQAGGKWNKLAKR